MSSQFARAGLFLLCVAPVGCSSSDAGSASDGGSDLAMRIRKTRDASIDEIIPYRPVTQLVDPLIGTGGGGNVIPGALVPHGAVRLSPDSRIVGGTVKAYDYDVNTLEGFSHTHLEGPGGSNYGYSEILVVPTRGAIQTEANRYASRFVHDSEKAEPGYYAVDLDTPQARAELTATRLCGVHRYTFKGTDPGNILIDVSHTRGAFQKGSVEIIGDRELRGRVDVNMDPEIAAAVSAIQRRTLPEATTGLRTVYFAARFNRPFNGIGDGFGVWDESGVHAGVRAAMDGRIGAFATFQRTDKPVELDLCLSFIDETQAGQNLDKEIAGRSFDEIRAVAGDTWNKLLNRVQVTGGTTTQQRIFYSALYHAFFQPADYTESGRFWNGEDGKGAVLAAPDWEFYADDWCMWDTFRTTHPLQTLLEPERRSDIVNSMVTDYARGGWMSKCTWQATGRSRVMIANPFVPIIADAYVKGFDEYDANLAWEGLYKASTTDQKESLIPLLCGYFNQGTPPDFTQLGYVSHDCDSDQSASMTLEHAFDAWAMSRLADALGKGKESELFRGQAANYKNVFNPAHGFMQGKNRDGSWVEPFDPTRGGNSNDFTEATSWNYSWYVPHDVRGLQTLMGGAPAFTKKLDDYFDGGHHDPGNEPAFEVPWLYDYAGAPAKTAKRLRDIMANNFSDRPDGLPGNDDSGAMSAWYVFAAIGLYPISPGDDTLLIGSPIFDQATIYLEPNFYQGRKFVIEAKGNGPDSPYVQSANLNGVPLTRPFLRHGEVVKGGTLTLQMGANPSDWGTKPEDAPPSMTLLQK